MKVSIKLCLVLLLLSYVISERSIRINLLKQISEGDVLSLLSIGEGQGSGYYPKERSPGQYLPFTEQPFILTLREKDTLQFVIGEERDTVKFYNEEIYKLILMKDFDDDRHYLLVRPKKEDIKYIGFNIGQGEEILTLFPVFAWREYINVDLYNIETGGFFGHKLWQDKELPELSKRIDHLNEHLPTLSPHIIQEGFPREPTKVQNNALKSPNTGHPEKKLKSPHISGREGHQVRHINEKGYPAQEASIGKKIKNKVYNVIDHMTGKPSIQNISAQALTNNDNDTLK
jgi:hypothetical protein